MRIGFDRSVLEPDPLARGLLLDWLSAGLAAVDPEPATADALAGKRGQNTLVIAIGKAAPAMARGADGVIDIVGGVCVTDHIEPTTDRVAYLVGDHPVPGPASLEAARVVIEAVRSTPAGIPIVALVSGGGSTLCDMPRPGVTVEFLAQVNRTLLMTGAPIADLNLVRSHLSSIKCGGLSRVAGRPIDTYVVSDVGGADPGTVASGPTIPRRPDPPGAMRVLKQAGIEVPETVKEAMSMPPIPIPAPEVTVVADGSDFARAVAGAAPGTAAIAQGWLEGPLEACLDLFLAGSGRGVTIAVGEPVVPVFGDGRGGRNTHAALLAATRITGSQASFTAFASDGVDGSSGSAGAIVDGGTIARGGDPGPALAGFDSAGYLARTSDLLRCGPTGTNVSDIWVLWRP